MSQLLVVAFSIGLTPPTPEVVTVPSRASLEALVAQRAAFQLDFLDGLSESQGLCQGLGRLYRNSNCVSHCNRRGFQGTLLNLLLSTCSANPVKKRGRKFGVAGSRLVRSPPAPVGAKGARVFPEALATGSFSWGGGALFMQVKRMVLS